MEIRIQLLILCLVLSSCKEKSKSNQSLNEDKNDAKTHMKVSSGSKTEPNQLGLDSTFEDTDSKMNEEVRKAIEESRELALSLPTNEVIKQKPQESYATRGKTAYQIMEVAFEGFTPEEKFRPMLDAVLRRHGVYTNRENLIKVADMLLYLRKQSKVGVTEVDIIKHMYQKGISSRTIEKQAAVSYMYLEANK